MHLIYANLLCFEAKLADQLQSVLDLVQNDFCHPNRPLAQYLMELVVIRGFTIMQQFQQPIPRLRLLKFGKDAR